MTELVRYRLKLTGLAALVMNSCASIGEDKGRHPEEYEREHYREKCYTSNDGELIIPRQCIKQSLMGGCKFMMGKPKGASFKSYGPWVQGAVIVVDDAVLDVPASKIVPLVLPVNLDPSKGKKGPKGKRIRPLVPLPWSAEAELAVLDPILTFEVLQEIAERAGKQVGILDGRAIDFGRYEGEVTRL